MIKTAHGEPWLCPFNGLFFCTLNPTGILNASSLNCQPDHGHTLHDNFRWPSITLRLKSKVLSCVVWPPAASVTPVPPTWCLTLPAWPLSCLLSMLGTLGLRALLVPLLETLFPRYASLFVPASIKMMHPQRGHL